MKARDRKVVHSSTEPNWRTPPELFTPLNWEFLFSVDAAADEANARCKNHFGPGSRILTDALSRSWVRVADARRWDKPAYFCNPPHSVEHGQPIDPWIEKFWREGQKATVVAVIPYSVQTKWFRQFVYGHLGDAPGVKGGGWSGYAASEIRVIPFRVNFLYPDGTPKSGAPGNTCVVIYRPDPGYVGPWVPVTRYWAYAR